MRSVLPSAAQAALALAIIRSKPHQCSIREYILQLRHHTRRGPDPLYQLAASQYLDLVEYWQEQYRQVQEECNQLRSLNVKLERSNHLLASRGHEASELLPPNPKRRKAAASSARPPKRARASQENTAEQAFAETQGVIDSDSDFLDTLGEDGVHLTEALFTTHHLCRTTNPDADALCLSLVRTCSTLGRVMRVIAQNYEPLSRQGSRTLGLRSLDQDKTDFAVALSVCARAFMSILVGNSRLAESCTDNRLPSLIICELAEMFKSGLTSIELTARQTAQTILSRSIEPKKGKSKGLPDVAKDAVPTQAIAHLLISFLGFLNKMDAIHQSIFDGFVFILLERVGKQLYYCTFGHHRSTSLEGRILPIPEPQGPIEVAKRELDALATQIEIKALVLILERVMGLAPNHMNPQTGRSTTNSNRLTRTVSFKNLPTSSRARLSPLAKDRLQRTLIACMHGTKTADEFLDVLVKPMPAIRLSSLQGASKIEEKDVANWYKQEIWRLVGWDVLAHERGW